MKRFIIHTFGCQMNVLDSERISDLLIEAGWQIASNENQADAILFYTCSVRGSAEKRALGRLTLLKPWRTEKKDRTLVLCGCMAQQYGNELLERFPFLDLVVGTRDFSKIPFLLEQARKTAKREAVTGNIASCRPEISAPRNTRGLSAFVTIMYGCDNYCSFCIVPYVRGGEVSRKKGDIIKEIRTIVKSGIKEVVLLGQNVNSYKEPETGEDFPALLEIVNDIPGVERIRYTTSHPKDADKRLVDTVARLSHVCEHFHLPVQSGSDSVLKAMNRKYTREHYLELTRYIRKRIPKATITTDLLVGFPGETDKDFEDTLDLCRKIEWDAAFMFMYSIRPGTAASRLPDDVPLNVKKKRLAELVKLQETISAQKNAKLLGHKVEALVERRSRKNPGELAGKDRGGRTVVFPGKSSLIGEIVYVRVDRATSHTLIGERINKRHNALEQSALVS